MKVLIVGIVRDVAAVLERQVAVLQAAFEGLGALSWCLVHSDSKDSTLDALERCRNNVTNFEYLDLGALRGSLKERTVRLAFCRNKYMEVVDSERCKEIDYVVVADFDSANMLLTPEKVLALFSKGNDWDVATANQKGPYYDVLALRHWLWCPADCDQVYDFMVGIGQKNSRALQSAVLDKMIVIPEHIAPIRVDSAFGGLGIYRKRVISGRVYQGADASGKPICEHVPLNLAITKEGYKIYVMPALTNAGYNEHSKRLSRIYRILRVIKSWL